MWIDEWLFSELKRPKAYQDCFAEAIEIIAYEILGGIDWSKEGTILLCP